MKTYSLKQLNKSFIKAGLFTIIMAILGGGVMFGYVKHKQQTFYTASRYVLISHNVTSYNRDENSPLTNADLNMMPSYEDIAENELIAKSANQYLPRKKKKKYSVNSISDKVSAKSRPQSLVLKVSVKTANEDDSVYLANAVTKALKRELPELQPGVGRVQLLAKASKADVESETTPNKKKYTIAGIALGGLLGIVVSFTGITWKKMIR